MRSGVVVLSKPLVDDGLGLLQAVEYLPIQEFIAELPLRCLS